MCGFCGMVGGAAHWGEMQGLPTSSADAPVVPGELQRERLRRATRLDRVARHYGVRVQPWADTSWILAHVTGETVIVERLADVWPAVERMSKRRCDPLDPALLRALRPAA